DGRLQRGSRGRGGETGEALRPRRRVGRRDAADPLATRRRQFLMAKMRDLLVDLERRRAEAKEMGGPDKVKKQHDRGKLTCRERLALFFDGGAFFEVGLHGTSAGASDPSDKTPADAVVCGWGNVNGRPVAAAAYDFTVKGGSIGYTGEVKVTRMRELA